MGFLKKLFERSNQSDYLYKSKDIVYYYDINHDIVRTLQIRHTMSGWYSYDWEYYNCICIDPEETWYYRGDKIFEPSQKQLYRTKEEANQYRVKFRKNYCNGKIESLNEKIKQYEQELEDLDSTENNYVRN